MFFFKQTKTQNAPILITGVSGYVGSILLKKLRQTKRPLRCLTRFPDKLPFQNSADLEVIQGDALNESSLQKALQGVDCAYYLVHSMDAAGDFVELDRKAAENFALMAAKCKVKRIIYVGGLGDPASNLSKHLKSRQEVGEVLREKAKGVQVIEFRSSIVIGAGSLSFEMIRALCEKLPVLITPGWTRTLTQPIAIRDLLRYLTEALTVHVSENPIFEIGGKDQVSYTDLMYEYCRQRKLKRIIIPVPVLSPYLSSLWLHLFTPLHAKVGEKLVDSIREPTLIRDQKAKEFFGFQPIGISEAIAIALQHESEELDQADWGQVFFPNRQTKQNKFPNLYINAKSIEIPLSASQAFTPIRKIGGNTGWYYGNWLWSLRGKMDMLFGGVPYQRFRKDKNDLCVGEKIDFWKVEKYERDTRLRLFANIKMPGRAWLQFDVQPHKMGSTIKQTAVFEPKGLLGILYWKMLQPVHHFIFKGMLKQIARQALAESGQIKNPNEGLYFVRQNVHASAKDVFTWFQRPGVFQRLTPPWENIKVIKHTGIDGGEVLLEIKKIWTFHWHLKHTAFIPGKQFCDVQATGPFKSWKHIHRIIPKDSNNCIVEDEISYVLPYGKAGFFFLNSYLRNKLKSLFRYRQEIINHDITIMEELNPKVPMKVVISGASGFIGAELINYLKVNGHSVTCLVRTRPNAGESNIFWNPETGEIDPNALEGYDAVINLSGENIAEGRWTEERKQKILQSRVLSTTLLAKTIASLKKPPKVFISASAIGFYGDHGTAFCTEKTENGSGFLANVCKQWEDATQIAKIKNIRTVNLRFGVIMSPRGGMLKKVLPVFKLGLGGKLSAGDQYMSWVAIDDVLAVILYAMKEKMLAGPVNVVAPYPVTNAVFTKTLGEIIQRPTIFSVPTFALRTLMGRQMADEFLLSSTRVEPLALIQAGYTFLYPALESALRHLLANNQKG